MPAATMTYIRNADGDFVCPDCGEIKKRQNTMFYHMKKHIGETRYGCPHCEKQFLQKSSLNQHILHIHTELDKPKVDDKPKVEVEVENVSEPKPTIEAVIEPVDTKPDVSPPEKDTPAPEKLTALACPCCDHSTKTRANLLIHIGRKHGAGWIQPPRKNGESLFTCARCEKTLTSTTAYCYHAVSCFTPPPGLSAICSAGSKH